MKNISARFVRVLLSNGGTISFSGRGSIEFFYVNIAK